MKFSPLLYGTALGAGLLVSTAFAQAALNGFATSDVNLRAGPGTDYPVVTTIATNEPVMINGCLDGWSWCDVTKGATRGWVSADYLAYDMQGQRTPFAQVAAQVQAPVVTYDAGAYFDSYYRDQAFYAERDRWANAQAGGAAAGAIGGAAIGAVVGGPIGAAVGAVAGAIGGAAITPPPEVRTYVMGQQPAPITVDGQMAVGYVLPAPVVLHPIPQYEYSFAMVNGQRVLVDANTRQVVGIIQ